MEQPKIFLESADSITPRRKKAIGTGYDIFNPTTMLIPANSRTLIDSKLRIKIPAEMQATVEPISVSIYTECFVINSNRIDAEGAEQITFLMANKMQEDYILPKGTLLGRLIYSVIAEKNIQCQQKS